MSFNGSGVYNLPAGQPVVTGTTISSTTHNTLGSDLATALSLCVTKDGQQAITANITMSGFKLTNLANATAVADAPRTSQVQNSSFTYLTSVAGTNTVTAAATPTPAAYVVGQAFEFIPANTNTGATTLNVSSLGAGAVQSRGQALVGGELLGNVPVRVICTATTPTFELIGTAPFDDARPLVVGSVDPTKKIRFEVDGLTTGTTRVLTVNDADYTIPSPAGQADQETGTSLVTAVTPGRQQFHQSALKAWARVKFDGTADASYNVTSIGDTGSGRATVTIATDFSSVNYSVVGTPGATPTGATTGAFTCQIDSSPAAGSFVINAVRISDGQGVDVDALNFLAAGDQ